MIHILADIGRLGAKCEHAALAAALGAAVAGMENPAGGLAIHQLVEMRTSGRITMQQFLELTRDAGSRVAGMLCRARGGHQDGIGIYIED